LPSISASGRTVDGLEERSSGDVEKAVQTALHWKSERGHKGAAADEQNLNELV